MGLNYKTFNYLSAFSCLGDDCEDTCCKSWDIRFDQPHYELLKESVDEAGGDLASKFASYVELNKSAAATAHNYAYIKLDKSGNCPFLSSGWCELHKQFGEKPLSNVCAFYPRVLCKQGDTIELSGALSCPEMVRKCLFSEKTNEIVEFEPSILPRKDDYPLTRELSLPADQFYYDHFLQVRDTLMQLVELEGFSLDSRLYFISSFANRLGLFYHIDAEPAEKLLSSELKQAMSVSMLERMDDFVSKYIPAEPVAIIVVQAVLQLRIQQFPHDSYSQFVKDVFHGYENLLSGKPSGIEYEDVLPAEELWQLYQKRRSLIDSYFSEELDNCFSRYLVNCLYREWFITMPDLFTYTHMLLIRLAILRFLVYSHPEIYRWAESLKSSSEKPSEHHIEQLRKYLVDVIYKNSRAIDHNTTFLQVVYDAIHEQQMMTHEYSLPFIKF
ncbi:MAG: flagellin lysine-N-methylase [Gammaproteobacteria bacterium]|nr:flagellin lysine-N-methylase [Gammaproteobacteria bacterium]